MPMADNEARLAYLALADAARECRLGWVLEQVEEAISMGKTRVEKLPADRYRQPDVEMTRVLIESPPETRGAPAAFVAAEQYTSRESLELLIDALLFAVPTAHQVAESTLGGIAEFGPIDSVVLAADMPNREVRKVRKDQLASSGAQVSIVSKLLNELKAEI